MTASTFNPLEAARDLEAAGIEAEHAEAIAEGMRRAVSARHSPVRAGGRLRGSGNRDEFATKAALAALEARMTTTLYRALWFQGGAIIAILTAFRFLPI